MYYPRCVSSARLTISTVDFCASVSSDWDVELSMFAFAMSAFSMLVASPYKLSEYTSFESWGIEQMVALTMLS